jgi:hypothetical protein
MSRITLNEYLEKSTLTPEAKEQFLHPETVIGVKFDPEIAYVHSDCTSKDGVGGCCCIYSYETSGARKIINYRNQSCRINSYGDSFTHGNQVSDSETWQEFLAGHFGEPIRNFGVGGHGVYQAYRRIRRVESGNESAQYIILNIFDDDHYRNLMSWRWLHIPFYHAANRQKPGFHAMPWVHVRLDHKSGEWIEKGKLI